MHLSAASAASGRGTPVLRGLQEIPCHAEIQVDLLIPVMVLMHCRHQFILRHYYNGPAVPATKMFIISTEGAHHPGELWKYGYDRQAKGE